nr:cysteine desulfurase mitochondrial-like [Ipomoea batatas]
MVLIVGHDDGEEGLIVGLDDRDVSTIDLRFVVVGRLVSDRPNLVVLNRVHDGECPKVVPLNMVTFWIQVHKLPVGFMSEKVAMVVGGYLGHYDRFYPAIFGTSAMEKSRAFGMKLWTGGRSGAMARPNRWLVVDSSPAVVGWNPWA